MTPAAMRGIVTDLTAVLRTEVDRARDEPFDPKQAAALADAGRALVDLYREVTDVCPGCGAPLLIPSDDLDRLRDALADALEAEVPGEERQDEALGQAIREAAALGDPKLATSPRFFTLVARALASDGVAGRS
jgi:hypothetical protein